MSKRKHVGKVWVFSHYKGNAFGGQGENTENHAEIEVAAFDPEVPVARVSMGFGMTLNLGDYNSCRVDCRVELPCYVEEIDDALERAGHIAKERVEEEVNEVRKDLRGKRG